MIYKSNSQLELAHEFLSRTGVNIFLTGRAGTGKTTFLHNTLSTLGKRFVVAAPTGVAALNARGVTLHSLFQLPFSLHLPGAKYVESQKRGYGHKISRSKRALIRSIELLVIDEISMVRSDLLDAVDERLREIRRSSLPFGGVQLLMVGDIHQLSPICRDDEWALLSEHYQTPYFFGSRALQRGGYVTIELQEIFRQRDRHFTDLLNAVRDNELTPAIVEELNRRYIPNFNPSPKEGYITLTTHVRMAAEINEQKLAEIKREKRIFKATIRDDFPESAYPNELELELKVGAQVIFLKNDISPEKLFYNGMIGEVASIEEDRVIVLPREREEIIEVRAMDWENVEYQVNPESGEIEENIKGTFSQLPLRCAWAITIHKSQGLSFERAIIDAGSSFAHGQVYVALSRCRTLEGMVLRSPLRSWSVIKDQQVESFAQMVSENQPTSRELDGYKRSYYGQVLCELYDFDLLRSSVSDMIRLIAPHLRSSQSELLYEMVEFQTTAEAKVVAVGRNFQGQIGRLIASADVAPEANEYLGERLKKGAEYFAGQIDGIRGCIERLSTLKLELSESKSRFHELLHELQQILELKSLGLGLALKGFDMERYQKLRYELIASDESKGGKKSSPAKILKEKKESKSVIVIRHEALYEKLVVWRKKEAEKIGKPAFVVLYNRALVEIQASLPRTLEELEMINGFGAVKTKLYGKRIIKMVKEYCKAEGID
ncbi:MAG: AAA family ATPase [Rikenellaceae bacterium]